jgi:hypothetical protein
MRKLLLAAAFASVATTAMAGTQADERLAGDFAICGGYYAFMAGLADEQATPEVAASYMEWSTTWLQLAVGMMGDDWVSNILETFRVDVAEPLKTDADFKSVIQTFGPKCLSLTDPNETALRYRQYQTKG